MDGLHTHSIYASKGFRVPIAASERHPVVNMVLETIVVVVLEELDASRNSQHRSKRD